MILTRMFGVKKVRKIIQYLGENELVLGGTFFMLLAGISELLQLVNQKRKKDEEWKKERILSFIIALCFILEGIMSMIPVDNFIMGIICTIIGVTFFVSVGYRYYIRKKG